MDWIQSVLQALTQIEGMLWPLAHPDQVIATLLEDSIGLLLKVWFGFMLRTTDFETGRDFVTNVTILRFEPAVQVVADSALVLIVVVAGYRLMWGQSVPSQYAVRALLPRLLMGTILINFALPLFQLVVQASNVACQAIQSFGTIPDWNTWWSNYRVDQTHDIWQFVATGALVVGYDILAVAYLVRYAILIVLAITAPIAGLLFTLPDTHYLAKRWASWFVTNLFMQPAQLFVLAIGFALESGGHTPVHHLFALAALLIAFKVPGVFSGAERTATKLEFALQTGLHGLQHIVARAG